MKNKKKFKNLFKNLKKAKKGFKVFFFLTLFIYIVSLGFLIFNILALTGIETFIRVFVIIALIFYLFVFVVLSLAFLISKKNSILSIICVLTLIFASLNGLISYYFIKTLDIVDDLSKDKIIYTSYLIKLNDTTDIKTVGMLNNEEDAEGYILPQEYLANSDIKYQINYYDDNEALLADLYDNKIDGAFITSNYVLKYAEIQRFTNIDSETVVVDKISKKLDNQDVVLSSNKSVTEPFTVLLLGVDSEYDGLNNNAVFNGDSIMLVTFNPKTLSATVFSIPRDTYVPIACNNNKSFKINSAAGYGTKCMIDTVTNLTGISIDYYVKINFKGVVSLVDALGGITLNVDEPDYKKNLSVDCNGMVCEQNSNREFGDNIVYITPGENVTLNGEQALAYARNRHQWALSDFKRIEHQQAVVTAIANKAKTIRSVNKFYEVLNAVSNNIDTNMSKKEILNFYNVGKNILLNSNFEDDKFINIQKTYLTGYDATYYINGYNTYTYQYYEESLNEIVAAMKENLEITKPEMIKEFSFSVNTVYEIPVIGKKYSSVKKNEGLPDFVGNSEEYTSEWVKTRGITLNVSYKEDSSCEDGRVINQSIHAGTITSNISSLDVTVCKRVEVSENDDNGSNDVPSYEDLIDEPIENLIGPREDD